MDRFAPTERTTIHRIPARGSYDRSLVHAVLDEGLMAFVGLAVPEPEGAQPYVLPMIYARRGDELVLHGAAASRLLKQGAAGIPLCVTVAIMDGIVFARSAFHHSINYRSVVVLGRAREVVDRAEKLAALDAIVEHVLAGRSRVARPPNEKELPATRVLALPITEASAKLRTGDPADEPEDLALPVWAGVLPLQIVAGSPIADGRAPVHAPVPDGLLTYDRKRPRAPDGGDR